VWLNAPEHLRVLWEDIMASKTVLLGCALALALALAACTKKEEAPGSQAADANAAQDAVASQSGPSTPTTDAGATPAPAEPNAPPVDGEASLTVAPTAVAGANMNVKWIGPGNGADYIDVVPRGFTQTSSEISYVYVRGSDGAAELRAPTTAGDYDVRYILDLSGKRSVKAVAPLAVTAGQATLKAPATAEAGQALEVVWTGPDGPGDYIDLVKAGVTATSGEITYAYTNSGSPAKIEAPSSAGDYQLRYVLEGPGGRKVPATVPLKVTTPKVTLAAPATATKGQAFKVEWTGPGSSGDYVDLVKRGVTATSGEIDYFYTVQGKTSGELTAPEAGEYDIRYLLEAPGGRAILATRPISAR
jgi:Ca-activated chloride channel homolog